MKTLYLTAVSLPLFALAPHLAFAHEDGNHSQSAALDHAPIGVMADHRHETGEWMLSYRYMNMDMDGNRDDTNKLSADTIATTVPNRFFGADGQPATLRVVPEDMNMQMHMIGAMYGLNERVTLMGMTNYSVNEMDHTTYMGGMGTQVLGTFTTQSEGFGDTSLGAIIGLGDLNHPTRNINLGLAVSVPTGSIKEEAQILTPMGMEPTVRSPYAMQLGTGTYDFKPSLTYTDTRGKLGWGAQGSARMAMTKNDEDYQYGDRFEATSWLAYAPSNTLSLSGRLLASSQASIDGIDDNIALPVQTADPDNYGGQQVSALIGVNLLGQEGVIKGHRLAAELSLPVYRDLNGPQLETDSTLTLAWQKAF